MNHPLIFNVKRVKHVQFLQTLSRFIFHFGKCNQHLLLCLLIRVVMLIAVGARVGMKEHRETIKPFCGSYHLNVALLLLLQGQ